MEWITTTTILDGLRSWDNDVAWGRFVKRFRLPVARFARRAGVEPDAAEDVAQEALIAFAESYRRGRYDRTRGRLSSWLFGIAYRHALRQRRRDERRDRPAARLGGESPPGFGLPDRRSATEMWDLEWNRYVLERCLETIRSEVRPTTLLAFELVALRDRPPDEVAETLGLTPRAVYNAKHRVLKRVRRMRAEFSGEEPPPPAAAREPSSG